MQVHDIFYTYTLWSLTQMSPNLNFYFIAQCLANVKIQIKWFIKINLSMLFSLVSDLFWQKSALFADKATHV